MPRPINKNHNYVSGLDGLRTLAVAVVVLYHLHIQGFVGGLLGVGVFFTLSGYLITTNLMRSWDKHGNLGLKTFWLRRFRRLMPAVILTLITVVILTAALERQHLGQYSKEALSALFYVNNWHTIFQQKSYFDNFGGPSPLSHMWSLSVEEQFYLFWPLLLLLLLVVLRSRFAAMIATLGITLASFVLMWVLADPAMDNTRAYEGTDTRAGGLLLGAALAIWLSSRRHKGQQTMPDLKIANIFGFIGVAGILILVVLVPQESIFLYRGGLVLLSVASLMAIFSVLHPESFWSKVLGWTPIRWLGERSYGIYLWHMPVIAFMPQAWLEEHKLRATAITVVATVVIAALSWALVEDPIRKHGVIPPIKAWLNSRKATQESGANTAVATGYQRPFPAFIATSAAVVLAAIVAVGATPTFVNPSHTGNSTGVPPVMELRPEDRPNSSNNGAPNAAGSHTGENSDTTANKKPGMMSCQRVVHVGDSTSIGMFSSQQVQDPKETAFETYREYGAGDVVDSVFGARSTTEGWDAPDGSASYPSAVDSVTKLLNEVPKEGTCWVIATGVNDAANESAGSHQTDQERIDAMMDLLGKDADVMWAMVTTNTETGHYARSNMDHFNQSLKDAQNRYPRLRLYDWPSECDHNWFAPDDYAHYGAEGNTQRAKRFAAALAKAFPAEKNGEPSDQKVLNSGL
ncbi:acyltransferase family protein [Corynebacterium anserum]|uniref:Acyltransferase family protein n=1 Tax=Corynebacterium anserum TaxID=2684406 RepID=A0A7G7YPE3_9CORY|nr:acyltransferase family protein [Corynebacterium anserum]MBC2681981.1 acyltransferase family protein [Corynebacterium anserum]QNH96363.1 acyltransferase family protein [Corynebacterium anserum]